MSVWDDEPREPMSNEHVVAHAACPVCGVAAGVWCDTPFAGGVHAGRYAVLNLPTLDEIARGQRLALALKGIA